MTANRQKHTRRAILLARDVTQVTAIECESADLQGVRRRRALSQRPRVSRVRIAKGKRSNAKHNSEIREAREIPSE